MVTHRIQLINEYVTKGIDKTPRQMNAVATSTNKAAVATNTLSKGMKTQVPLYKRVLKGATMYRWALVNLAMGAMVFYGAFKLLAKPAIELESEMANVRKTTGFTREETDKLRMSMIDLSKTLPMSAKELATIAAVAGQLGIGTQGVKAVENFTKVISMMTIATEMSAEVAAKNLAKISKAFDIPISSVNNLGSVINELSNTTAATSTEIVSSMVRIGAAGANLGMTAEFAAALGATLVSSGMRAERAGTRMRSALIAIQSNMKRTAEIAGMTEDQFKELFAKDTNLALMAFFEGLEKVNDSLDEQATIAQDYGKVGGFVLQTLGANVESLRVNVETANDEWENGLSLLKETATQTETTANQWKMLINEIKSGTLANEGWINSLLKSMRLQREARLIRMKEGGGLKEYTRAALMFPVKTMTPAIGIAEMGLNAQIVGKELEKTKEKLKEAFGEERYEEIEKLIDSQKGLQLQYDMANKALDLVNSKYQSLAFELETVLDGLDEENDVLKKNSPEWEKAKGLIEDVKNGMELGVDVSDEFRDKLDALEQQLAVLDDGTKDYNTTLVRFKGAISDVIAELEGTTAVTDPEQIKGFIKEFSEFFVMGDQFDVMREKIEEMDKYIIHMLGSTFQTELGHSKESLLDWVDALDDLETSTERVNKAQGEFRDLQKEISEVLSVIKEDIKDVNAEISNIGKRRFDIRGITETDVSHTIKQQELALAKARFSALGLGSAEEFLRNSIVLTTDSILEQDEAIQKLIKSTETGQDRYEAWQTTLRETIRSLLISSQDIGRDVTEVVKNAQTELLSITRFDREKGDQFSAMEHNLDALSQAQGIFFGGEQEELRYSEALREDRINGMNESASQAIANLANERNKLAELIKEEEDWISLQEYRREEIEENREAYDDFYDALIKNIDDTTKALKRQAEAEKEVKRGGDAGTSSYGEVATQIGASSALAAKMKTWGFNDFISRPGQPMAHFNPNDTIVGIDQTKLGGTGLGGGNISININGYNRNPNELAIEVARQIKSLA